MKFTNHTNKYLKLIKKIKLKNINTKFLENLLTKSKTYIDEIITTMQINNLGVEKIETCDKNILKQIIINSNIKSEKHKHFFNLVKNNKLSEKKINKYLNFNCDTLSLFNLQFSQKIKFFLSKYPNNLFSRFVPAEIKNDVFKNMNTKNKFEVKYKTNKLIFNIYSNGNINKFKIIIMFYKAIFLLELYNKTNFHLEIDIFLSKLKKKYVGNNKYLDPSNINSGLTSFTFSGYTRICIFREEELHKVLLHEMTHATYKDNILFNKDNVEKKIKCNFYVNFNNVINFTEAYTETCAIICNSLFNSIFHNIDINLLINNEIKFFILQCSKILTIYNLKNLHKFYDPIECLPNNTEFKEKTSVLSYFFLKLGVIYDINYFLNHFFYASQIDANLIYEQIKINLSSLKNKIKSYQRKFLENNNSLRMSLYSFKWNI